MAKEPPSQLLLVEGVDDKHVVRHLCQSHQSLADLHISERDGWPNIRNAIGPEIKTSGRTALGILVDANRKPIGRWQAIADQVRRAGLDLNDTTIDPPTQMAPSGTIFGNKLRVGIWLMPDNGSPGELEDFIAQLIPTTDPVWPRAHRYIDNIPYVDRKFVYDKIMRAKIHAWLAARESPRPMGAAIGAGDLDATKPLAMEFKDWLQQLFV